MITNNPGPVLRVMVTQTWSYYYGQLDRARSHWIKVHVLRGSDESISFCGLVNRDDEGEMTLEEYYDQGPGICKKCVRGIVRQYGIQPR